jgi:hypothetical protein
LHPRNGGIQYGADPLDALTIEDSPILRHRTLERRGVETSDVASSVRTALNVAKSEVFA